MMKNAHPMALKLTAAAVVAVLAKVLPKFLFNRTLYRMTGSKFAPLLSLLLMIALSWWLQGSLFSRATFQYAIDTSFPTVCSHGGHVEGLARKLSILWAEPTAVSVRHCRGGQGGICPRQRVEEIKCQR